MEQSGMNDTVVYMTAERKQEMELELERLRTVRRQEVAERIRSAKDDGDISESGEYEDAKREQAFLEGTIRRLEYQLRHAQLIDPQGVADNVTIGRSVTVVDDEGVVETYLIVGPAEVNARQRKISNESPIGAALLGKRVGDQVRVQTPSGAFDLTVQAIS
jgi:transcription elongation factor GreA